MAAEEEDEKVAAEEEEEAEVLPVQVCEEVRTTSWEGHISAGAWNTHESQ